MQSNLFYILLFLLLCCSLDTYSQDIKPKKKPIPSVSKDTVPVVKKDSLKIFKKDSILSKKVGTIKKDSIVQDSIKPKEAIDDIITAFAKDYTFRDGKKKTVEFYNEAHVTYTDIDLKAGVIIVDYLNNTLFAKGIVDSTG